MKPRRFAGWAATERKAKRKLVEETREGVRQEFWAGVGAWLKKHQGRRFMITYSEEVINDGLYAVWRADALIQPLKSTIKVPK